MLEFEDLNAAITTYIEQCENAIETFPDGMPDPIVLEQQLESGRNSDIRTILLRLIQTGAMFESQCASMFFLNRYPHHNDCHYAVSLFKRSLESEDSTTIQLALGHMSDLQDIPTDLEELLGKHAFNRESEFQVQALELCSRTVLLRTKACMELMRIAADEAAHPANRLLSALRLICLNVNIDNSWKVIDELEAGPLGGQEFRAICLQRLASIVASPELKTIDRLLSWSRLEELSAVEAAQLFRVFSVIKTPHEAIDNYFLTLVASRGDDYCFTAAKVLRLRQSKVLEQVENILVEKIRDGDLKTRETCTLALLKCYEAYAEETIEKITKCLDTERDIEVLFNLMRICQKAGYPAFKYLIDGEIGPRNLRTWIRSLVLGWLGDESIDQLFRLVVENPNDFTSYFLSMIITGARLNVTGCVESLSSQFELLSVSEKRTVLIALQNVDESADFLTPQLLEISLRDDFELADLAKRVILSIGVAALGFFPKYEDDYPPVVQEIRRMIEFSSLTKESNVFADIPREKLRKWALASRLIADGECRSLKDAANQLSKSYPSGWSEQTLKRAGEAIRIHLQNIFRRDVVLFERGTVHGHSDRRSTKPIRLGPEGLRILELVESYLAETTD